MSTRPLALVVLAVTFVAAAAGCGSSNKSSATTTTAAEPAATTTEAMTTEAATTTAASSSGTSFTSAKNCAQLASLAAKVAQSVGTTSSSSSLQEQVKKESEAMHALADAAPSEIKGDVATFADAFAAYAKAIAASGLSTGQAPSAAQIAKLTVAAKAFSNGKVQVAVQHLSAWGKKNCNLTTTNP